MHAQHPPVCSNPICSSANRRCGDAECGNALGLVRTARQAGLRVASTAEGWAPPRGPPAPPPSQRSAATADCPREGQPLELAFAARVMRGGVMPHIPQHGRTL